MSPFNSLPQEDARVEKQDGTVVGPYKAIFTGEQIIVPDEKADIDEGDTILRGLPNGKDERFTVTDSTFYQKIHSIDAHYQIKYSKGGISKCSEPTTNSITINNAQAVQIGDHNTQNIVNALQELSNKIESADCSPEEKAEARSLLNELLTHPLVVAIIGATTGSVIG
tara:strand:+ start:390 stop:893 length:504 start_codon:yes stop_codon:yes gene_type:complete